MQTPDLLANDLSVTSIARGYLTETAKWAKFLSIMGFIMCCFMAIASFFLPLMMSLMPQNEMAPMAGVMAGMGFMLTVIYLGFALLLFMPCLYLYRFSVRLKNALLQSDSLVLDTSFSNLKSFFKFYGIMTIVILSFYALAFIIGIVGVSIFNMR